MAPALLVIAKAPVAGPREDAADARPARPSRRRALAAAALEDTLAAVLAVDRDVRRVLVLDGEPGPWIRDGFEVVPQRGDGLAARLAAAFDDAGGPAFLVGMDTPQVTPALLDAGLDARSPTATRRSAPRSTAATGGSACASPTRACSTACR